MAVRDRNLFAWQAYVITMAFVSVGLLLGMFFLWRSYSDLAKRFEDQGTSLTTARSEFQSSEQRVERLLSMMGYGNKTDAELTELSNKFQADEVLGPVEKDFQEQMNSFPPGQPTSEKNLLKLPKFLLDTIRIRNEQIDKAREREAKIQAELTDTIQRETAAREDAVAKQKQAELDLATSRQSHATEIARLNKEKDETLRMYSAYKAEFDKQKADLVAANLDLSAKASEQAETIAVQTDIINGYRNPDFAKAAGKIVNVANGGTEVWINLGRDDGLREGVPFSIIDESAVNISEAVPKAKLQITRVVSEHLSQARVTDYDYRKTVVTGDKVYSPAWRPGRTVGFALVGVMDMNGDGKDDINQVKELIRMSGGNVDEAMNSKGAREKDGEGMSPNTSFLVMGTDLTLRSGAVNDPNLLAQQQARLETYAKFRAEARAKGIIEINLDKLMGYLKTEGSDRTIPLGNRLRGEDFPIRQSLSPPVSRGSVSEIFKPRSPN